MVEPSVVVCDYRRYVFIQDGDVSSFDSTSADIKLTSQFGMCRISDVILTDVT